LYVRHARRDDHASRLFAIEKLIRVEKNVPTVAPRAVPVPVIPRRRSLLKSVLHSKRRIC
jgi:hypothetical protein